MPFSDVLRNIDADAAAPQAAGPGHWNDPDYLAPDQGMSAAQFHSQLSMWAMLAAPLMISDDLTKIGSASLAAVQNTEVIAIDQDPAGVQGTLLSSAGNGEVWVKPLDRRLARGRAAQPRLERHADRNERERRRAAVRVELRRAQRLDARRQLHRRLDQRRGASRRHGAAAGLGALALLLRLRPP